LALINRADPDHPRVLSALNTDRGPYIVPSGILAEITYMIEARLGNKVLDLFLEDLETSAYCLDCGEDDFPRVRQLVNRYANLPLGYADAAVIACAERSGGKVLTLDLRDFGIVASESPMQLLPS
jgi:predicted nucleic acid-binding protein